MRLFLFLYGRMHPGGLPIPGYLIQTDAGQNILVDTGFPRSYVEAPRHPPGLTLDIRPEDTVTSRLAEIGLLPADIDMVVCSHFDDDHSGNHDLFPSATFLIQREHFELARTGHPRFAETRPAWDHPALNYVLVDGDAEIAPNVELLSTSGHVPGHQSVLLHLPVTGAVLLAVDAVMDASMADPDTRQIWITDWSEGHGNETKIRESTRKVARIAVREGAIVIYGHDARQWSSLRLSPDCYE
ncbi:N-acyl homoserine lactonase family protein [Thioclava sp. GXIMD4216]|uniref:N-acyl homoserine lactonase family protein n=1 Tax=unclassified Thioclava TaxID=2621713 RepID=UPI0030D353AB